MFDKTTNGVALAGLTSPAWLPTLADVSQTAAMLLPVLGCAWLIIQMVGWWQKRK